MQANDDLAAIADEIKQSPKLSAMIATASNLQLMQMLRETQEVAQSILLSRLVSVATGASAGTARQRRRRR